MKAFVPYLSNNECSNRFAPYRTPIYETYLCAGGRNDTIKTDTCSGKVVIRFFQQCKLKFVFKFADTGDSGKYLKKTIFNEWKSRKFILNQGGPIQSFGTVNNKPRMILYGVVSIGVKCLDAGVNFPGIYTNVAYYLKWILDNMV